MEFISILCFLLYDYNLVDYSIKVTQIGNNYHIELSELPMQFIKREITRIYDKN